MLILKDEHAIDVLKSGNTGHLWHDFHAIGVHATDVGHPDDDDDDEVEEEEVLKECLPPGPALFADEPLAAVLNMVRLGRAIDTITKYPNI